MAIVNFDKEIFEKEIGKINESMKNQISMFGTPVEKINNKEIQIEIFPNRQDLLSYQGFKRSFLAFLGRKTGLKKFNVTKSGYKLIVDTSLPKEWPYAFSFIVKGLKFNDKKIKEIIDLQEKLEVTLLRKRKKGGLGIYPLEKINFPLKFKGMKPSKIKFRPLESSSEMTGNQILSKHPTGRKYSHIVKGWRKFPVFVDDKGIIMSMPPIINSHDVGKIDSTTRDIFIECTGPNKNTLKDALNIVASSLSEIGGKIYSIECTQQNGKKEAFPDFTPEKMKISLENVNKLLGLSLKESDVKKFLERMGYDYSKGVVSIPAYRTDVLHEVDLIEDIAIAYGYENFVPEIPEISTIGQENPRETIKRKFSEIFFGLGMLEVSNHHLTNEKNQFGKMSMQKKDFIKLEESKTDYNILRKDLSHYMLKILSENIDSEYPQKIFEIGKTFDLNENKKITESEKLAVAISSGNFTEINQIIKYFFKMIDMEIKIEEPLTGEAPRYFIEGRVAKIIFDGKILGFMGDIHPRILKKWKIKMPVALCEISLEEIFKKLE
jgi:phenylalanyl-tRNA synthetase beta chain